MASAVCQNQFLGSRISLISKSEIRYEGILYALDLCEATISLAKVRSFGTEDRPTDRPIPSKDEIFEYIIFRGADIKSIDVVEPPKHAANPGASGVPADPAIVEFSHSNGNGHFSGAYDGGRGRPNANLLDNLFKGHRGGPPIYGMGPQSGAPRRRSGGFDAGMQGGGRGPNRNSMGGGGGGPGGRQQYGPPMGRMNYGGNFRHTNNGGFNPNNGGGQFQQRSRVTTPNRGGNYGQPQRRGGRQGGGGGGGGRPLFRSRGKNRAAFPPKVSFDGDYDFEKANEELLSTLAKAKLDDETGETKTDGEEGDNKDEAENKEPRIFYKKDDFFDSISCEALERSKGNVPRVDWKAERKLNEETFGLPKSNNNNSNNGNMRQNRRGGNPRYPRGGNNNMYHPGSPVQMWMMSPPPSNHYYRGGNRRQRMTNN